MKTVILMRHAKSDWNEPYQSDHERSLNKRGRRDAPIMAKTCAEKGIIAELILVSDARRTQETWKLISPLFPNVKTFFTNELYLASSEKIIQIISQVDNLIDFVMIIGHNPGITETFYEISNVRIDNVPTAGIGFISCHTDDFKNITSSKNQLEYFVYPKML